MTWNSRLDVTEALEAAGWVGDERDPLGIMRHPSGAVWAVVNDAGDCGLTTAKGANADFPGDVEDQVVVAACLAATGQAEDHAAKAARLRTALESAKRRAARRQPHEREGLIFHLERENKRIHEYVQLANDAAQVSNRSWKQASEDAQKQREKNGQLLTRIDALTKRLAALERRFAAEECRCPEPATACQGCGDACHDEPTA